MPDQYGNQNGISSLPVPSNSAPSDPMDPRSQNGSYGFQPGVNDQTGGKMPVYAGQNYGSMYGQAGGMAGYFDQAAQGYNQNAPNIQDVSQLNEAGDYYHQLMQGDGGYAQNQFRQSQDQSIASQMAMAGSARGGAAARAGAQRAAQQGAGTQMAAGANQAAQIASQEEQAGAQGMAGIGAQELQRGSANAQLQQANQAQINQMQTSLYGMGEQEQGLQLSAEQAYMQNLLAAEGINTQQSQFNTNLGMQVTGAGLQAGGALINAASDERLKTDVQPQGGMGSLYAAQAVPQMHALNSQPQAQRPDMAPAAGVGAGAGALSGAVSGAASGGVGGALAGGIAGAAGGGLNTAAHANPHDQELKIGNTAAQAGIGAASGAAGGAALGPVGAGIGALIGGGVGLMKGLMS